MRLDRVDAHAPGQTAERLGQLKRLDQPQAVRAPRGAAGQLGTGPGERSDRPGPARRRGGVDDDRRVMPFQALEQLEPAATLCAVIPAGSRGRSRSIATQPSWSSPCGLPRPTIRLMIPRLSTSRNGSRN